MATGRFLTEKQDKLIQELLDEKRRGLRNPQNRTLAEITWDEGVAHQAPEVYIAKTQSEEGLPPRAGDVPGYGECDIYQVVKTGGVDTIVQVPGLIKSVFNFTNSRISANNYFSIYRDKFGRWVTGIDYDVFLAVVYDKVSKEIIQDPDDPAIDERCAPQMLPRFRGEYSFFEVEPDDDGFGNWDGKYRIKPRGRFGVAGECDAAHEVNRSSANIHLEKMIVEMHGGAQFDVCESSFHPDGCCPSSEDESSAVSYWGSTESVVSTRNRYWFNLGIPREDCARRYLVNIAPLNDFESS